MAPPSPSASSEDFELIGHDEASMSPETLAIAQAWLQPTDYTAESSEFHRHLSSQGPGTGLWVCDTPRFRQWHDSDEHGSLWIKGVPGAGKSVIAASMVDHLSGINSAPVLFFFFRYIVVANRKPRGLVRDWLAQLLPHSVRLQASLQPLLSGELDDASDEALWEHLLIGLSSVEKAYCIVDALDEMELAFGDGFLGRLNDLAIFRPGAVKLLMTSRPKQYLQSSLRDASIVHISLEHDLVGKDIALFVSHRLESVLPDNHEGIRDSLASTIREKSRGLFLYARLLSDQIMPTIQAAEQIDVGKLARGLPVGLEDMYNSMLFQQAESLKIETAVQVFLLECVTHSSRPLRLNELASVLASKFLPEKLPATPKAIARSACAPLLNILEDETVQVIHHSFTEFLLDGERGNTTTHCAKEQFPSLDVDTVHKKLAVNCLNYLQSGGLIATRQTAADDSSNKRSSTSCQAHIHGSSCDHECALIASYDYQAARLRYPFLEYAVENWAYHSSLYGREDNDFFRSVTEFAHSENASFRRWVFLKWHTRMRGREPTLHGPLPSTLHIAAYAGLTEYAKGLIHRGQSVHDIDVEERTPLHLACRQNQAKIVSLLLKNGANPDPEDIRGAKPIHEAARRNNAIIVKTLLEAGVDPVSPKTRSDHAGRSLGGEVLTMGETAVEYVCRQGHADTLMVMIPYLQPATLEEALCESCRYGKVENTRGLLENSHLSPNAIFTGATALYLACWVPSLQCVELLLTRGADVHLKSTWRPKFTGRNRGGNRMKEETPLHALVTAWTESSHITCQAIFRILMKAGADLEAKDGYNESPLFSQSSQRGCPLQVMVQSLLEAGADVSVVDRCGNTVLHRLLEYNRDLKYLQMLFDHGADVNAKGGDGKTALHAIFAPSFGTYEQKHPNTLDEIVKFLLDKGADCNIKNDYDQNVLDLAIGGKDCNVQTFKYLLKSCSDDNTLRRCLFNVNLRHNYEEKVEIIRELVSAGISLEACDTNGKTALLHNFKDEDTIKALLQCGARIDVVDSNGWGLIDYLAFHSSDIHDSIEKLQRLVDMGISPYKVDKKGNSILHHAVRRFAGKPDDIKFVKRILDYGISVNIKNFEGYTPLHDHIENCYSLDPGPKSPLISLLALFQRGKSDKLDINAQDGDGLTLLHVAAMRSEMTLSELLVAGADPSILTNNGRSVLHLACRARKSNIVGYLLQVTGNVLTEKSDSLGRTPLHDACTSGRPESVCYLLKAGAKVTARDSAGRTPLHACAEFATEQHIWASITRHDDAAGQFNYNRYRPGPYGLIKRRDEPWYRSPPEDSCLPAFTEHDSPRIGVIVKSLLAKGADINDTDSRNFTPLDLALEYNCQEMTYILWSAIKEQQRSRKVKSQDVRLQTLVALKQKTKLPVHQLSGATLQEVIEHPLRYLSLLDHDDIKWLAQNGDFLKSIENASAGNSLLHVAAQRGLTEEMACLSSVAKTNDDTGAARTRIEKLPKHDYHPQNDFIPILHSACQRSLPNLEMLEFLIEKCSIDVNVRGLVGKKEQNGPHQLLDGQTALHVLADARHWWQLDAMELLVMKGADINAKNEKGETPLHIASTSGSFGNCNIKRGIDLGFWRPDCLKILLDLGADPNALDNAGMSPLNNAASAPEIMRTLVRHGASHLAGKVSALFSAIQSGNVESVKVILNNGASPDSEDLTKFCKLWWGVKNQTRSALFCASFLPNGDIAKFLIERGADMYMRLNDRETLVHFVFEHAEYCVVERFIECAAKVDLNARDHFGRTVLLAACDWTQVLPGYRHKHWDDKVSALVIRLLDCGADLTAVDNERRHALHHLLDNGDIEQDTILEFLERKSCQSLVMQKDAKGFTPLHYALRTLRPPVCEALMTLGCDLAKPDPDATTALHYIASQALQSYQPKISPGNLTQEHPAGYFEGCLHLWRKYVDLGGDINVRDATGSPPLFSYLSTPQRELTHWKLAEQEEFCHVNNFEKFFAGADLHARNAEGETALHVVARREKTHHMKEGHDKKLLEFLVGKGLDPLVEDANGRSALDVAAACGKAEILELFRYHS